MPPVSTNDSDLLVLLGLRLRSFATAAVVADSVGLPEPEVERRLVALGETERARFRDGRMTGWMLTDEGRREGERRLADELDAAGARTRVTETYQRFLGLNQPMLDTCTRWQLRSVDGEQVVNDHTDPAHDSRVIGELADLDSLVRPIVADLTDALGRFGRYGPRLAAALERVQAGEVDWFTKPTIDSYHTVWFELHENLLATLGIERSQETSALAEEAS